MSEASCAFSISSAIREEGWRMRPSACAPHARLRDPFCLECRGPRTCKATRRMHGVRKPGEGWRTAFRPSCATGRAPIAPVRGVQLSFAAAAAAFEGRAKRADRALRSPSSP